MRPGRAGFVVGVSALTACAVQPAQETKRPADAPSYESTAVDVRPAEPAWAPARAASSSRMGADGGDAAPDGPRSDRERAVDAAGAMPPPEKNYVVPAVEILAFELALNAFDRSFVDHDVYSTDGESIRDNLGRGWVIDKDPFSTNQFGHPYSGSIYHGFARSSGLNYWEALVYDFAGSAVWEVAGETGPPSTNDQINTTFAGSFLGEALFRTANMILRCGGSRPDFAHRAAAFIVQPSSAVNRFVYGDKYGAAYPCDDPAYYWSLDFGWRRYTTIDDPGVREPDREQLVAGFDVDYGTPGKRGYEYDEPFDYFHFEGSAISSGNFPEVLMVRGLLLGKRYESGPDYSGIWGLYGTYDYFVPESFKVSSTGLGVGTTGQWLLSDRCALQGTGLLGGGFTAAGTAADRSEDREYRYSASPQGLLALRFIGSDALMVDLAVNDYYVSGNTGSAGTAGGENIVRASVSLTVRVVGRHAVGVQFVEARRDSRSSSIPDPTQSVGALSVFYTFLGDEKFGVVRE
jgi:hypothetical protein